MERRKNIKKFGKMITEKDDNTVRLVIKKWQAILTFQIMLDYA